MAREKKPVNHEKEAVSILGEFSIDALLELLLELLLPNFLDIFSKK